MVIMNNGNAAEFRHKSLIEICGLNKWFGSFHVLRDISLYVASGEPVSYTHLTLPTIYSV